ncbi:MAG: histidinol-phosphatase [Bacteroidota bacterium]
MWTNYHSHSEYCDGKFPIDAHLQAAIQKGFYAFGCSSHAPVDFENAWSMDLNQLATYVDEIRTFQQTYREQLLVFAGLEVDYIPDVISPRTDYILEAQLDYTVGSVHFVDRFEDGEHWGIDGSKSHFLKGLTDLWHGDIEAAVRRYYALIRQMVEEACPDVIGHIDKIKLHNHSEHLFSEDSKWYRQAVRETLDTIRQTKAIVEVNTRGIYKKKLPEPYPSLWILKELHQFGIPICLNSDSHHPREIDAQFQEMADLLLEIGFQKLMILDNKGWRAVPFTREGIEMEKTD